MRFARACSPSRPTRRIAATAIAIAAVLHATAAGGLAASPGAEGVDEGPTADTARAGARPQTDVRAHTDARPGAADVAAIVRGMAGTRGVAADFEESVEMALLSQPLTSRGRLYFVPPDRLARFTREPAVTALIVDGERVRFREGEREDDLSGTPMTRHFVDNLIVLWSGDVQRLERSYRTRLRSGGRHWELELRPRHAPLDRFIEHITLSGDGPGIDTMVVVQRDGDRTTTVFRNVEVDRAFAPSELERLFERGEPLDTGRPPR